MVGRVMAAVDRNLNAVRDRRVRILPEADPDLIYIARTKDGRPIGLSSGTA